jgi:hypothetical protein
MGLDLDYVFANDAIDELKKIFGEIKHGERKEITDDIINFVDEMKKKYAKVN